MKKELDYFTIEGCYGGNQDWFTNLVMHMGGCAAATACDSCIYFGLQNEKMKPLYPFDIECLTKEDYKAFSQIMKPYLKPHAGGVRKLSWFVEGLGRYIQDVNEAKHTDIYIRMEEFCGDHTWQEAAIFINFVNEPKGDTSVISLQFILRYSRFVKSFNADISDK